MSKTTETLHLLGASNLTISDGGELSGYSQGDGSHMLGKSITLNSTDWEAISVRDNDGSFADNDGSQRLNGDQAFDGKKYADDSKFEAEYGMVVQDPDGNTYTLLGFNINEGGKGASYATVEGLAFVGDSFPPAGVPLKVIKAYAGPSEAYADMATPACFTAGCRIATPDGLVPVEALRAGDRVGTADHGTQEIRWIAHSHLTGAVLRDHCEFRPILVRKDALGPGCPDRDIRLSPQHRVLIGDERAQLLFGEPEVFVPVKKLVNGTSILRDDRAPDVAYFHLLLERHEVIWSDGMASESYLPEEAELLMQGQGITLPAPIRRQTVAMARPCISDKRTSLLRLAA